MSRHGQAVFEFVIASLIIFSVIFYTINYISMDFGMRHNHFMSDVLEDNAMRVSDILLSSHQDGIVTEWPRLSTAKMTGLNTTCSTDYIATLQRLGLKEGLPYVRYIHMNITAQDNAGTTYINCGRTPPENVGKAVATRFGILPSTKRIVRIVVTLW